MDRAAPARSPRAVVVVLATGLTYYALASAMWAIDPSWGSAFWPAAGVTFAVCVRSPARRWPAVLAAVALAELTANLQHDTGLRTAVWGAVANAAEPCVGAGLFRLATRARRLQDMSSVTWLVLGGALAGPAVGAGFGALLAVSGPDPAATRWFRWFLGDGVGVLAVAPVLLVQTRASIRRLAQDAGAALAGLVAIAIIGVALVAATGTLRAVGPYLAVPVLLTIALRLGVAAAAASAAVVATIVHTATATGHGAFVDGGSSDLVVAQTFLGVVCLSTLTIAVLTEDVRRHRHDAERLYRQATRDPLTGLANRAALEARLAEGSVGGLLVADIDEFKSINDSFGHLAGDQVLREVAERLRAACRPEDLVARAGGDEFVIILGGQPSDDEVDATAERVAHQIAQPIDLDGRDLLVQVSVGAVAGAGAGERDPAALLGEADRRMYERKPRARPAS